MKIQMTCLSAIALGLAACASGSAMPDVEISAVAPEALPSDVRAVVFAAAPDIVLSEIQKKVRDGRTYYDVEGELESGEEIEFDILMTPAGPEIVEIQRDIAWTDAPANVRAAAGAGIEPERVIESRQTDGSVIYELFAAGKPADPSMEVMLKDGAASVLETRWPH